jgi:hypothetical protein
MKTIKIEWDEKTNKVGLDISGLPPRMAMGLMLGAIQQVMNGVDITEHSTIIKPNLEDVSKIKQ